MAYQTSYTQFQPAGFPGMSADMAEWDGRTRVAQSSINFGAPVQRNGDHGCDPLTSGEYIGIAKASHLVTGLGDGYAQYDNVPVVDEGVWFGLADAAFAVGVALNWNSATQRWTSAAATGTIYAVPQAEAEIASSGVGALIKVRLRRIPS
jgi:hypothetical protein